MNRLLFAFLILLSLPVISQTILGDPKAIIYSMDIMEEKNLLVVISDKEKVEIWNYESQSLLYSWKLDSRGNSVAFSNNKIVITKANGVVDIYDALNFEKLTSQKLIEGVPLLDVKVTSENLLILADGKGNVYKSDSSQLVFHKLFSAPTPVKQIEFLTTQKAIVTFHSTGSVLLWSLDGSLLNEYNISKHVCLTIKNSLDQPKLYASFRSGKVKAYSTNQSAFLQEIGSFKVSQWPMSIDFESDLVAVGTTGGQIRIYTKVGTYKARLHTMVNSIRILSCQLPKIVLVVGTHGGGINLISATNMKIN